YWSAADVRSTDRRRPNQLASSIRPASHRRKELEEERGEPRVFFPWLFPVFSCYWCNSWLFLPVRLRDREMWKIVGGAGSDCSGLTRRNFLQAGVLGLGGLTLAELGRIRAETPSARKDTCVILFWLSGGPGHMETWDPKPEAVAQYRGPFGAISTAIPGVQFGELLPEQARVMDKLVILRTVNHGSGDHTKGNHWMLTGFAGPDFNAPDNTIQRRPALGSVSAMFRGANRPGMPAYVGVPHLRGGTDNLFHYAAYLGGGNNPFIVNSDPNEKNYRVRDLSLST